MQIVSRDKTVRINRVQDLKYLNTQSIATKVKKGEQLVSMMPAIKAAFDLMDDDIKVELSTENEPLKTEIGSYDGKWLEESEAIF